MFVTFKASTLVSVTVAWSAPFDSGGLPVLGYKARLGTRKSREIHWSVGEFLLEIGSRLLKSPKKIRGFSFHDGFRGDKIY